MPAPEYVAALKLSMGAALADSGAASKAVCRNVKSRTESLVLTVAIALPAYIGREKNAVLLSNLQNVRDRLHV